MITCISDIIDEYTSVQNTDKENEYLQSVIQKVQNTLSNGKKNDKLDSIQQLFFLNLIGLDTSWAHFYILEVMASSDFSSKSISYLAASLMWNSTSDASLMATNRITKDLTSGKPLITSIVLSSVPFYLSPTLSQLISTDVIKLMQSSSPVLQQKAITTFYHICLHYPDALKAGFSNLRSCLDDPRPSVLIPTLWVINELCIHNPNNFVALIPKLFKIFTDNIKNTYIVIKLVQIFTLLSTVEKRLPKKLVQPYSDILSNTSSMSQLYDIVKSIVRIPITQSNVLNLSIQRIEPLIVHNDPNIKTMFMKLFMKLIIIEPKFLQQHKESVTQCLSSKDESECLLALDLISSLANAKSLASIVSKMVDRFKVAYTINFRNEIIKKIIFMCSQNDYEYVSDFEWYIDVLMEIIEVGGFNCFKILSEQILDLALRVPSTRKRLCENLNRIFNVTYMYLESEPLMLAVSHIAGSFADSKKVIEMLLSPFLLQCNERVQQSFIISAFKLAIRINDGFESFAEKLETLKESCCLNVKTDLRTYRKLATLLLDDQSVKNSLREILCKEDDEESEEVEQLIPPPDLNDPISILQAQDSNSSENATVNKNKGKRKGKRVIRRQKKKQNDQEEVKILNKNMTTEGKEDNSNDKTDQKKEENQQQPKQKLKHKNHTKKIRSANLSSHAFAQVIGQNNFIRMTAVDFIPDENRLTIKIKIENLSSTPIPSFDVKIKESKSIRSTNLQHAPLVESNSETEYSLEVEVLKPNLPNVVDVVFTPVCFCSCDSIETHIKLFPSFYLKSAPPTSDEPEKCQFVESISVEAEDGSEIDEIISLVSAVLKTTEVKMSEEVFMFFAKTTFATSESEILTIGKVEAETEDEEILIKIEVKSGDKLFTNALIREIELRLKDT